MTKLVFAVITCFVFIACNNTNKTPGQKDMPNMTMDSTKKVFDSTPVPEIAHSFSVDPKLTVSIKTIVNQYLQIKNALVNNSGSEAAKSGKAMAETISKMDTSLFTTEQKKIYDGLEEDLKENAEHIGKSGGDIDHQREHFVMMSEDIYDLVKAFGSGQTLYQDYCPMANDDKGATWLSETKEVKNPYFSGNMNECVKVQNMIK
ncbi:MAG TPA: DUF3347 domain-containing protein [Chitinophagaceae bacterium]